MSKDENWTDINRPMVGTDLGILKAQLGLDNTDLAELLELPALKVSQLLTSNDPLPPQLAIITRLLYLRPDLARRPNVLEMWADAGGEKGSIKKRQLSVCFGQDGAAGYSWAEGRPPQGRTLKLARLAQQAGIGLEELRLLAEQEGKFRGVNPMATGGWKKKTAQPDPFSGWPEGEPPEAILKGKTQ